MNKDKPIVNDISALIESLTNLLLIDMDDYVKEGDKELLDKMMDFTKYAKSVVDNINQKVKSITNDTMSPIDIDGDVKNLRIALEELSNQVGKRSDISNVGDIRNKISQVVEDLAENSNPVFAIGSIDNSLDTSQQHKSLLKAEYKPKADSTRMVKRVLVIIQVINCSNCANPDNIQNFMTLIRTIINIWWLIYMI